MTATEKPKRILPTVTLEQSFQLSRQRALEAVGEYRWAIGNVPRDDRRHLYSILALSARSAALCDIHIGKTARLDLLDDLREDMRNNFMEEESTDQFPALLDTMRRFHIPQQYLHDIVAAADMCLRIDQFDSFDQWLQFGYRMGGGTMLSVCPIFGSGTADHESSAIACGQAIWLTWLLDDIGHEIQKLQYFLPQEDVQQLSVDLEKHNPVEPDKAMLRLIRLLVSRIESLYEQGGQVVRHLELDGQRTMRSLISVFWNRLAEIKMDPARILIAGRRPGDKPGFRYRFRHLMGLEGGVPVLPETGDDGH